MIFLLLERCCLPAILKACTALKNDRTIDHLYTATGSAPKKKKKTPNNDVTDFNAASIMKTVVA